MKSARIILPIIVISQFCCTSLWFAGNAVLQNLVSNFQLSASALGHLTSAVQIGFILGTLSFAILTIADRFSPSKVFFISALLGAFFNVGMILENNSLTSLLLFRFCTGFFLAGIYPIGMKIAADYFEKGLGKSLGFLVGALVLGTAFPHLLKGLMPDAPWRIILMCTSILASVGSLCMFLFVPNGPFRIPSQKVDFSACVEVFKNKKFRSAAFGYFGHMWELYAFWTFVPIILSSYDASYPGSIQSIPILSFFIIGIGGLACVIAGYLSVKVGTKKTASMALLLSCFCCLFSPIIFTIDSLVFLIAFLLFWGMVVIADSPLFSTMVAKSAPTEWKGTALTIVNCIGFSITIVSIQLINSLLKVFDPIYIFMVLAIGPIFGLTALFQIERK